MTHAHLMPSTSPLTPSIEHRIHHSLLFFKTLFFARFFPNWCELLFPFCCSFQHPVGFSWLVIIWWRLMVVTCSIGLTWGPYWASISPYLLLLCHLFSKTVLEHALVIVFHQNLLRPSSAKEFAKRERVGLFFFIVSDYYCYLFVSNNLNTIFSNPQNSTVTTNNNNNKKISAK